VSTVSSSLAFCFLTKGSHNQSKLWYNFFQKTCPSKFNIYCHNKEHFQYSDYFLKNYEINKKIPTEWGDISLVKATLLLFKEAFKNTDNKFFILLSESCIPLYNFSKIYNFLNSYNTNLIDYDENWDPFKDTCEWNYINKMKTVKDCPFFKTRSLKKASQWLCLDRQTVDFFLKNDHTNIFSPIHAVDENYFSTLIKSYSLKYTKFSMTFTNWGSYINPRHPQKFNVLNEEIITKARHRPSLFMRKISPSCDISNNLSEFILKEDQKCIL
jgi:hypothetical protein